MTYCITRPPEGYQLTAGLGGEKVLSQLQSRIDTAWCNLMHESIMWPVHGRYECRSCGRQYPAFSEARKARTVNTGALAPSLQN